MVKSLKNDSGFALVLTLVVTALMVAVVVEMVHQVYVDTSLSRGFRDGQQASILAESGATGGARLLQMALSGRSYTALTDLWATPIKLEDEAGSLEIVISEENGKLNINGLVQPNGEYNPFVQAALSRLGARLKLPLDISGVVADWLDSDDMPRSGGAEYPYYRTMKPPYNPRNGKMLTLTELSLVKEITPQQVGVLRPYLTVFSDVAGAPQSTININTAPKEVLSALDDRIDERMAARIIDERKVQPFKSTGELSRVPGMDTIATGLIGKISVKGNLFKITSMARVKDSGRTVEAIVRLSGSAPEILSWQEY
ncbi:MAG: type II secretion system minor pseudopilin GspK [Desulfuromonadaceae bacterium]|nr:type II secretion system minor pseudopilin GspK [Desulfuromonadaceae bacterium]MDD5104244.1 type II secretion system minor pseudopilin GspK [Desulfuromonadaceae bacterium]